MAELKNKSCGTGSNTKENGNFPGELKGHSPKHSLIPTLSQKVRQPLTPIHTSQKSGRPVDNDMVKVKKTGDANGSSQGSKNNLTQIKKGKPGKLKTKTGENSHRQDGKASSSRIPKIQETKANEKACEAKKKTSSDQIVQTENPDVNLVTGDEAPPEYYKQLAETRREALEETLKENKDLWEEIDKLQEKVKTLEKQNEMLVKLVDEDKVQGLLDTVNEIDVTVNEGKTSEDEAFFVYDEDLPSPPESQ